MITVLYDLVGKHVGRGTLYLYKLVGECAYLYVGRGRDGQGKVGRTKEDQGKDVVPLLPPFAIADKIGLFSNFQHISRWLSLLILFFIKTITLT